MTYSIRFAGQRVTVSVMAEEVEPARLLEVFRRYRDGCVGCHVYASRHQAGPLFTEQEGNRYVLSFPVQTEAGPGRAEVVACIECCLDRAGIGARGGEREAGA